MIDISKGRFWDLPWSLVDGCIPCSPGCDHCWSAGIAHRFQRFRLSRAPGHGPGMFTDLLGRFCGFVEVCPERLSIPLKRRKPTVYAVWNDWCHEDVSDEFRTEVLQSAVQAPQHTYLALTKRPQVLLKFMETNPVWYQNWWLGLTVCNQQEADEKIPIFLQVPGKKFLSLEPLLGPVDLGLSLYSFHIPEHVDRDLRKTSTHESPGIDAVILGGESGPGARPMHPDWVRSVRDQCAAVGVPFFFKSWGAWKPCDDDHEECEGHKSTAMRPTGEFVTDENPCWKDKAFGGPDQGFWKAGSKSGRLLDGRTYDDLPWRDRMKELEG